MEKVKVSIIIPVYNTAAYLEEAVDSILCQTLAEIEIIAVNDGSTDNSLEILRQIQQKDARLHICSQPNQGQSVARNTGMQQVLGEFVYFFDSDDFLRKDALESCYTKAAEYGCDLVFFDAAIMNDQHPERTALLPYQRKELLTDTSYTGHQLLKQLMNHHKFSASPCLNLIRTSYLQSIGLTFYPGIIHEDQLFTFLLYLQAEKVSFIAEDYFHRRLREHSTMTSPISMRNINGYLTVCDALAKYARQEMPEIQRQLVHLQIAALVNITASTSIPLSFGTRMGILKRLLTHFAEKLQLKSILLLLLPCLKLKKNKLT